MERKEEAILKHWKPLLVELYRTCPIYDLENLLKIQGRCLVGFSAHDLIQEAKFSIKKYSEYGFLNFVETTKKIRWLSTETENLEFSFTEKFLSHLEERKIQEKRSLMRKTLEEQITFYATIIAAVAAVVGTIISIILLIR